MRTALLLLLLASPALAQTKPSIAAPPSSCGPTNVQFGVKRDQAQAPAELEPGKALIYVIGSVGDGTIRVGLDGAWIGANSGNSHFSFSVPPGEHHLCANVQSRFANYSSLYSLANFTAEGGEICYFRTRFWTSDSRVFFDLNAVNSDEGSYLVTQTSGVIFHPKK
jgi:hypothetical protein